MISLYDVFSSVAYKTLTQVDLPEQGSHQHEINGVASLREFFKTPEKINGRINWHYFADDEEPASEIGVFTFYDARAKSADRTRRSEWRFYYTGQFLDHANPGDALILAKTEKGEVFGLIFEQASNWLRAARVLFGFEGAQGQFQLLPEEALSERELELQRQLILEELGLDISLPTEPADEELVVERFGRSFPTTKAMSDFARSLIDVDATKSDQALTEWIAREEKLFRALERVIVEERLHAGFTNVDDFIGFSLSVHNRRKSRMGNALQNHLEALFLANQLRFSKQIKTEGKNKPDFLFPGGGGISQSWI